MTTRNLHGFSKRQAIRLLAAFSAVVGFSAGVVALVQFGKETLDEPAIDVSGTWLIRNTVEETKHEDFKGLVLEYHVSFSQNGKTFHGDGDKWSENGKEVRGLGHTPIEIHGTLAGQELRATCKEKGRRRQTTGHLIWVLQNDKEHLSGRFDSTAGDCRGRSELIRRSIGTINSANN